MNKTIWVITIVLGLVSCNSGKTEKNSNSLGEGDSNQVSVIDSIKKEIPNAKNESLILSKIDSVSVSEIKYFQDQKVSIFDYYAVENIDEVEIWSDKMFGRCCTEADLSYSELLYFEIISNIDNNKYPSSNLSDFKYQSTYVFKESDVVEISIGLNRNEPSGWHHSQTLLEVDQVLKKDDTLLKPFKLSLVNGYVKSEKTFKENGSVKEMKVYLNDEYKATVKLLKSPLIQEFEIDFKFSKDDIVKLIPQSYYKGTKYEDICISEIQSSLAQTSHYSVNKKYNIHELREIGYAKKKKRK